MSQEAALQAEAEQFAEDMARVRREVQKVIAGQEHVVECVITSILCGGNVLLEGVPGLGKTELVKTLAGALHLDFGRVQFTPDLMPADILGTKVMTTDGGGAPRLEFQRGPVFTQLLLADEINRATPKTQSALLECMQEGSVTAGGDTYSLQQPFFVLATQNPLEHEGTYQLPEAQLDRFLLKVDVPFLDRDNLNEVLSRTMLQRRPRPEAVLDGARVLEMREVLRKVVVADPVRDYAVRLVLASHPENEPVVPGIKKYVRWGASPRAGQALIAVGRVRALADGRVHLSCEDMRHFAREVFQHRIILNYDGQAEDIFVGDLIGEMVEHTREQA